MSALESVLTTRPGGPMAGPSAVVSVCLSALIMWVGRLGDGRHDELDTANFFRWSMNTCRLTSSVNTGAPAS